MNQKNYKKQGAEGIPADSQQMPTNQLQQVQNQIEDQNQQLKGLAQQSGMGSDNVMSQPHSQQSKLQSNQPDCGIGAQRQFENVGLHFLSMCSTAQETVQDLISAAEKVFNILREIQPPSDTTGELSSNGKRAELQVQLQTVGLLFEDLRFLYDYISVIPLKNRPKRSELLDIEEYKKLMERKRELIAMLQLRNKQLLEIINILRFRSV
ncbi:hypothetical protein ZHAS_00006109 [Anopheles sinensis]|uniref:Mediator of RNA polymerase II transcription subunit 30 n=1 Tax=Anopheles sinensis TaxID=74873 RepID=A0A084VL64_ANOSI|nr:hypothetical protein ZHAS_00006109 [Anopheles sinensis]